MLRVFLFVVLLGGGVAGAQYGDARDGSVARLVEDLRDHRVKVIEYDYSGDDQDYNLDLRWSTGPFSWWERHEGGDAGPPSDEMVETFPEFAGPQGWDFENTLRRETAGQNIKISPYGFDEPGGMWWASPLPGGYRYLSALAWLSTLCMFGVMLSTRDHRYANRWAWLWMFMSSPLGMLGYLWLEKRPLPPPLAPRADAPIGGWTGFLYSIGLSITFTAATFVIVWLITGG
ncbi:hypothetical protein [Actinocorallia lasiicapitis]